MWIKYAVKTASVTAILLAPVLAARAQYYYKDIVVTGQISDNYRALKAGKVTNVTALPSENGIPAKEGIRIEQTVNPARNLVVTHTRVPEIPESWLSSYYNEKGQLVATTDSSEELVTRTTYQYNAAGLLTVLSSITKQDNLTGTEVHQWTYNTNGKPASMLKIKDNIDTTFVTFEPDEKGNAGEEKAVRRKGSLGSTYYYYDAKNRLTDIARYNRKADRILPDYMFEYDEANHVTQMIIVPEGSSDYQTWKYYYTEAGLKKQDVCFSRQRQVMGKVDYQYSFQ